MPLDSGPFAGNEKKLEEIITSVWASDDLKIVIEWAEQLKFPEIYKFLFHGETAGRAYVWHHDRLIPRLATTLKKPTQAI